MLGLVGAWMGQVSMTILLPIIGLTVAWELSMIHLPLSILIGLLAAAVTIIVKVKN